MFHLEAQVSKSVFTRKEMKEENVISMPPIDWPFSILPVGKSALFPDCPCAPPPTSLHPHTDVVFCVSQLAQILPTEENFLLCFRQHVGSSAEFMEVSLLSAPAWRPTLLLYSEKACPNTCRVWEKLNPQTTRGVVCALAVVAAVTWVFVDNRPHSCLNKIPRLDRTSS